MWSVKNTNFDHLQEELSLDTGNLYKRYLLRTKVMVYIIEIVLVIHHPGELTAMEFPQRMNL